MALPGESRTEGPRDLNHLRALQGLVGTGEGTGEETGKGIGGGRVGGRAPMTWAGFRGLAVAF